MLIKEIEQKLKNAKLDAKDMRITTHYVIKLVGGGSIVVTDTHNKNKLTMQIQGSDVKVAELKEVLGVE